ncbi:glutamate synthase [NADH] [Tilletia horrida]|nr:glutamate synthase [NADH] [Tilletia horrida]
MSTGGQPPRPQQSTSAKGIKENDIKTRKRVQTDPTSTQAGSSSSVADRAKTRKPPESSVINFLYFLAEELRGITAKLGLRSINEMVNKKEGVPHQGKFIHLLASFPAYMLTSSQRTQGKPLHKTVTDAKSVLCSMAHRGGAVGADTRATVTALVP